MRAGFAVGVQGLFVDSLRCTSAFSLHADLEGSACTAEQSTNRNHASPQIEIMIIT